MRFADVKPARHVLWKPRRIRRSLRADVLCTAGRCSSGGVTAANRAVGFYGGKSRGGRGRRVKHGNGGNAGVGDCGAAADRAPTSHGGDSGAGVRGWECNR
jgi:hypothetical protein